MRARRRLALLASAAMAISVLPMSGARAATVYTVHMGAGVPHGFTTRVLAPLDHGQPTIRVAQGDTVNLVSEAIGGVVLPPAGTGPQEWGAENTTDLDAPFGNIHSDPDPDLQEPFPTNAPYKFNPALFGVTPCGATADDACQFDGSTQLVGGDRFPFDGNFFVEVTAAPGTTLWALTPGQVNRPSSLRIRVVATGVDTQSFIDQVAAQQLAKERDSAQALHQKLLAKSTKHKDPTTGRVVHDAYAGYDTDTLALLAFYPKRIVLKKGQRVRWHFSHLGPEIHGLAFPFKRGVNISNESVIPVCDPDGDSGPGPDTFDVDFETFSCPPASGTLELDLSRALTAKSGDGKFPGGPRKVENSGLRGPNVPSAPGIAGGTDPYDLQFTKPNAKGYRYVCTFHGRFMNGKVVVRR